MSVSRSRKTTSTNLWANRHRSQVIRPRNRNKMNLKAILFLFLGSMLFSCCIAFAVQTPWLAVREVRIEGVRFANRDRLQRAARQALGQNILTLQSAHIRKSIAHLPEVESVCLKRVFPRTLRILVYERNPAAILLSDESAYLIQSDGYVFHKAAHNQVYGLPVIKTSRSVNAQVGKKCTFEEVLIAIRALGIARKNRLPVSGISIDRLGDMCLNMCGGMRVKLGQPDSLAEKIAVVRSALNCKPSLSREAEYLDVTCPKFPVYRPRTDGV